MIYKRNKKSVQKSKIFDAASVFDSSAQGISLQRKADMANNAAQRAEAPRPNNTGMPDNLKAGIESLSGFSMDNVRVHYNSSKPATVQALAYTQGIDIHVAPGQEKHLPHEAWHVAQQMAGRVSPTTNINGMPVNDNAALEHEADVMGEKALHMERDSYCRMFKNKKELNSCCMSLQLEKEEEFKENPEIFMQNNLVTYEFDKGMNLRMKLDQSEYISERNELIMMMNSGKFENNYFVLVKDDDFENVYVLTPAVEKYKEFLQSELYTCRLNCSRIGIEIFEGSSKNKVSDIDFEKFILDSYLELICDKEKIKKLSEKDRICLEQFSSDTRGERLRMKNLTNLISVYGKKTNDSYIEAAYAPFKTGLPSTDESVGCCEITDNPDFVFTAGMNGCALVVTEDKKNDENHRFVWHFQNPHKYNADADSFKQRHQRNCWYGWEKYGRISSDPESDFVDKIGEDGRYVYVDEKLFFATNLLWKKNKSYEILSQIYTRPDYKPLRNVFVESLGEHEVFKT